MRKRILLIDDDPFFIKVLSDLLTDEFQVVTATSGEQAIDILKAATDDTSGCSGLFDLIITDLIMPGLSGYDVASFVKGENRQNRFTPVIMLTGAAITKEETRKHGCATYIPKTQLNKVVSMARVLLLR